MESNFIKERTVVREDILKKNLKNDTKKSISLNKPLNQPLPEPVIAFEEALNDRLKLELVEVSKQVSSVCETIADYLKIKSALKIFKETPHDIRLQSNIGCNFYAQCRIEDAKKIYLCVGKDYYLHMELDEALTMIDFLETKWTQQLDHLQLRASKIKACIKLALEALGVLYERDE